MDYLQQMNLTDFTLYDLINVKGVGEYRLWSSEWGMPPKEMSLREMK